MGSVINMEKTYGADRLLAARRPIARARISPQRADASQSELALLGDRDAHALQNAEDVFHDLWGWSRGHSSWVDGSLVGVKAEVLGWGCEWHGRVRARVSCVVCRVLDVCSVRCVGCGMRGWMG